MEQEEEGCWAGTKRKMRSFIPTFESAQEGLERYFLDKLLGFCGLIVAFFTPFITVAGYLLSILAAGFWGYWTWTHVIAEVPSILAAAEVSPMLAGGKTDAFRELAHAFFESIEILLLVPLPGLVGAGVARILSQSIDPDSSEAPVENDLKATKRLALGALITVCATRMVDSVITGEATLASSGTGAIVVVAIAVYVIFALPEKRKDAHKDRERK